MSYNLSVIEKERKLSITLIQKYIANLHVFQEMDAIPSNHIEVYDGHYMHIKHKNIYKNLMACYLTGSKVRYLKRKKKDAVN